MKLTRRITVVAAVIILVAATIRIHVTSPTPTRISVNVLYDGFGFLYYNADDFEYLTIRAMWLHYTPIWHDRKPIDIEQISRILTEESPTDSPR